MARATLSPLLNTLSGPLGNFTVVNIDGLFAIRAKPKVLRNPQSTAQIKSRKALAVFVEAWRGLTLSERSLWVQVAVGFKRGQKSDAAVTEGNLIKQPRGPFTAYNAFITCNLNRYLYDYSILTDVLTVAPIGKPILEPLLTFTVTEAAGTITPAWTYITPGVVAARLGIWIKSGEAGIHPQLIYTEARNADGNTDLTQARAAEGRLINFPNGKYNLQAVIVDQYGFTTAPSKMSGEDVNL